MQQTPLEYQNPQSGHAFHLSEFDGPLDLLLYLIKKNEVNIYDIPLAQITEQYLAYLALDNTIPLEQITEFHLMASTLVYLKSKMLLPIECNLDNELEDPRRELVGKLIEYQKYKKLTQLLQDCDYDSDWLLERKAHTPYLPADPSADPEAPEDFQIRQLLETFAGLMKNLSPEKVLSLYEEVSVNEKIALIHEYLDSRIEFSLLDLVIKKESLMELICSFLAILESVKTKLIIISQARPYGEIRIRARPLIDLIEENPKELMQNGF
jgi:segregation and condensation protein A